jgi:hypothetical protein
MNKNTDNASKENKYFSIKSMKITIVGCVFTCFQRTCGELLVLSSIVTVITYIYGIGIDFYVAYHGLNGLVKLTESYNMKAVGLPRKKI